MSKKLIVGSVEEFRNPAVLFGGWVGIARRETERECQETSSF